MNSNPHKLKHTIPNRGQINWEYRRKYQHYQDDSLVEIIKHLKKMGYKVDIRERYSFFLGAIHAVLKRQTGEGGFQGVAEVRRDGTAGGLD